MWKFISRRNQSLLHRVMIKYKFTTESILLKCPHHLNLPAPAKSKKEISFWTGLCTVAAAGEDMQGLPFPTALCVWTGCSLRSSLLHLEFSCGAPPWKH